MYLICRLYNISFLIIFFSFLFFSGIMKGKTIYMGGREGEGRVRERHKALREGKLWGKERGRELRGERRE